MDFGALPPEINSLRMYSGPGAAPMLAAMTAWSEVADEMRLAALGYDSVIAELLGDSWLGPAAAAMAAAVTPYLGWMNTTALQAEQTAGQAAAAAAAFEAAFAMTVPPAAIAANRAQLLALVATNFLGVNTPAIAATEAAYAEMWAQDATAMYGYAASAAEAATLSPFTEPAPTTNPAGPGGQAAAVSQASGSAAGFTPAELPQLMAAVPSTLQELAAPAADSPFDAIPQTGLLADILNFLDGNDGNPYGIFLNSTLTNGVVSAGYTAPAQLMPAISGALADISTVAEPEPAAVSGAAAGAGSAGATANAAAASAQSTAGVTNQATLIGRLSVPPSWTTAAGAATDGPPILAGMGETGPTAVGQPAAGTPGMPGMPVNTASARNWGNGPRYGFRPTVMPRPVAAG